MDHGCTTGFSLGLSLGTGTTTREKDRDYASQRNVSGPPVQLDQDLNGNLNERRRYGSGSLETITKEGGMGKDWGTELSLGLSIGIGTTSRDKDHQYAKRSLNLLDIYGFPPYSNGGTKLKQTEVDCKLLKRRNELLEEENIKLLNEVKKLRTVNMSPLRSAKTLTICASCANVLATDNNPHYPHYTLAKVESMLRRGGH